ncbi:gamma-aminobutyric acid type B receptor subunit 2 [Elysia marginata]|uniref:Gamma-aminobutyric acid type B receptor subunit 2 n=1 Tax=Elysia marginata TaxID=1093978 RepID=A0AAV4J803_9GAST|nr:gamma-aminobutyric acid type B receptor subunit 2 [Elysia marginata]
MFDLNLESLEEIAFEGVSGPVSFTSSGRRLGPHLISRYEDDVKTVVGFVTSDNTLSWHISDHDLFYGRPPPLDRMVHETRLLPPSQAAIGVVLVTNCFGITAALAFLTFNILYRKNSHIKMSSPVINNVIVLGGFLMYIFVFVLTADYANWCGVYNNTVCSVRVVLACLGFTVAFGALFSKTWRVHALFTNNQMKRKVIKDSKLLSLVLVLVVADLIILIPWTVVKPLTKAEHEQEAEVLSETALGTIESVLPDCDVRSACIHHTQSHYTDTRPTRLRTKSIRPDTRRISCQYQFQSPWFDSAGDRTHNSRSLSECLTARPQSRCRHFLATPTFMPG